MRLYFKIQANPPSFDRVEDLASLQYLNESSVMHSLRQRYGSNLVHTYAGTNMVVINPVGAPSMYSEKVCCSLHGAFRVKGTDENNPHSPILHFLFLQGDANVQGLQKGGHRPPHLQHCTGCLQEPPNHSPGPIHCLAWQEWQWKNYQLSTSPSVSSYRCWNHQQDLLR